MRRASGTLHVFTFKEGVLSRVAHDLALRLERCAMTLDGDAVEAEFELGSLFVEGPVESGVVRAERLDPAARSEIERAMREHVLDIRRYPTARFTGTALATDSGFDVSGALELAGRSESLSFAVHREKNVFCADFELSPRRWGIAPYRALFGAIRLRDRLRIVMTVREDD